MNVQCLSINNCMKLEECSEKHAVMLTVPTSCQYPQEPHSIWWENTPSMEEAPKSLELGDDDLLRILHKCRKKKDLAHAFQLHTHIHSKGLDTQMSVGNHLVPLFVDCGGLAMAEKVFYKLIVRNEFSWTAMIQGYVGCGEYQHALDLFDMMQKETSIFATRHTFLAVLKACARIKWLGKGREIHKVILNDTGLQFDPFVGNTLVDMYAKCGSLDEAREVFHKLPIRDVVSWNALITGYAEIGLDEETFLCLEGLKSDGLTPDCITLVGSLKACANARSLDRGLKIHSEIVELGSEPDPIIGYSLVEMYAKCASFMEARRVFDKLPSRDVVSWTVLMVGYTENNLGQEALECFDEMQQEGVLPDVVTFVCSLKACGIAGDVKIGKEMHAKIVLEGFEGNRVICNVLVDMYATLGCLEEAQDVFEEMSDVRDVISWNILIESYVEHGLGEEALACLPNMQSEGLTPNVTTFTSSLKACSILGDVDRVQDLLVEIVIRGLEKDQFVTNSLVDAFGRCGSFTEARNFFEEMQPVEDTVSWNILISSYVEHGFVNEVIASLEHMQEKGIGKDAFTCVSSLKSFGSIGDIARVLNMHMEIINYGFQNNVFIENSLVDAYLKCGYVTEAQAVFDNLLCKDSLSWNTFMMGLLDCGFVEDFLYYMDQMEMDGLSPDAVTFLCVLKACSMMGLIEKGQKIHAKIVTHGIISHPLAGSSLIDMYVKFGFLEEAKYMFDKLPYHDVVSWTELISGFAECGNNEQALGCLNKMRLEGINPNAATYICCLKMCGNSRTVVEGMVLHNQVIEEGFDSDSIVTNTIVDMYGKLGLLSEAEQEFDGLLIQDAVSWTSVISSKVEHGHPEKALMCVEQMQKKGIPLNALILVWSLRACATLRALEKGLQCYAWLIKLGLDEEMSIGMGLVEMLSNCGLFVDSHKVLQHWQLFDTISWMGLIVAYAEYGHAKEALECFDIMQIEGVPTDVASWNAVISAFVEKGENGKFYIFFTQMLEQGLLPNRSTFGILLGAYGHTTSLEKGRQVHAQINGNELFVSTALIDMYSKCGSMADAQQIFDASHIMDSLKCTALITGYARQGNTELVFHMFEKMKEEGIQLDEITFLSVLNACSHGGLVKKGQEYYMAMIREYGLISTIKHHSCMVDLLCRAGRLNEAIIMLEKFQIKPDLVTWSAVLSGCQKWGKLGLGFQCTELSEV